MTRELVLCTITLASSFGPVVAEPVQEGGLAFEVEERLTLVFEGFVSEADGSPAEGAVVVSSAGGKAVTDPRGRYRLEVLVPIDAQRVQVTAVGRGSQSSRASVSVALPLSDPVSVGPLQLAQGNGCSPSWLPTFGEFPGTSLDVGALAVFDDGGGPDLYVGGSFSWAGGTAASRIARWDGTRWSALGAGIDGAGYVLSLATFDDGGGPALYAGGRFLSAGGGDAKRVAKWDGSSWSALGSGTDWSVNALALFDDGGGEALYAAGYFTDALGDARSRIARWDGTSWSPLLPMASGRLINALAVFDDGTPSLYAGGSFLGISGDVPAQNVARWDGSGWSTLGSGLLDFNCAVAVFDDGGGPAVYVGSSYTGSTPKRIVRWDGASWSPVGGGTNGSVLGLTVFDDGSGPALYAGGGFTSAGGVTANYIARWDGTSWSALGSGMNWNVNALAVFDDGGGEALYAAGIFTNAGGVSANYIARWDGTSWSALGSGTNSYVHALTALDDGGGAALYVGGMFTSAGGVAANRVARWDGASWSALGSGVNDSVFPTAASVFALAALDDSSGPALYAAGRFTSAGGVPANRIARWDGSGWSALGRGLNDTAYALTVFDDGGGRALYAGGVFSGAGGVAVNHIARWDGASWSPVGSGMNYYVLALATLDDGNGPALYAAGGFTRSFDSGDCGIAKFGCPPDTVPPTLDCPGSVHAVDRQANGPGEVVTFVVTASDDRDPEPDVVCVPPSGSLFLPGTTIVHCTATDAAGNESICEFPVTVQARVRREQR